MKKKQKILSLRPTQFAVGMLEVDEKVKVVKKYNNKELKKWLKETVVPVVVSPRGELYVVDHHHFLCVCYHLGIQKVNIEVVEDFSNTKLNYEQFWKKMHRHNYIYPYCQFGEGPREPLYLPKDLRGLADDPYRSLAWFVRKAGAYENMDKNFAEFKWANFFRSHKLLSRTGDWGFARALVKAVRLAQSPKAKHLPGYESLNLAGQKKTRKKLRKQVSQQMN